MPAVAGKSVGIVDGSVSGLDDGKYPPLIPLPKEHHKKGNINWRLWLLISRYFEEWETGRY